MGDCGEWRSNPFNEMDGDGGNQEERNQPNILVPEVSDAASEEDGNEVVLRLRGIEKSYPIEGTEERVVALRNLNLCEDCGRDGFGPVRRGEFVMIRGPSGGGKTTLLSIIGTIDLPTSGTIELMGTVINGSTPDSLLADFRLRKIGFVFQTFNLISTMTALENVELPMTLLGALSAKKRRIRAFRLLALVGLRNRLHHLPSELSGGEQQRVTIARSLANNPQLLLLDEPTGDLDTLNTIQVMDLLVHLNRITKTTCIMVTHNPDVECYADRILYVADSRFVKEVRNSCPQRLVYEAYVKNLEKREAESTAVVCSFQDP
ncbi:ABC transporter, putative [Trypanosoma cruzi]|uniref:ABC transporter n=2 Tax=Trypanosoma cruzi TaxID=5693 RepID=V5D9U5_TRYCR|nr:ABC transporter, putative [Trypanosoma cruzi]ESS64216.1 ABC transporter [Trypanosoma cruzi Dm28c]PBJ72595.1 ABC transporter [Trypanosoma cruzi cruzi]KAF8276433.1 putative ABC transporter [Trypanosoma cruzi]PWU99151.1 putative ABC transporter [Trypanosoma cruzi]